MIMIVGEREREREERKKKGMRVFFWLYVLMNFEWNFLTVEEKDEDADT
jgi:hypothetical protein